MKDIVFIGTPTIAADLLENLIQKGLKISQVITKPDKKTGRKQTLTPSEVKERALQYGLEVVTPEKIRDYEEIYKKPVDLIITCAYGQILPKKLLDYPTYGCINLHGSLLPKYRGGAPVQRAIWNADEKTGIALMKMDEGLDTGPVLDMEAFDLANLNTEQAFSIMSEKGADLIMKHLDEILSGTAEYTPQDDSISTYAPIIKKDEEKLDFDQEDEKVLGQILALAPAPGAWFTIEGKKFKILNAVLNPDLQVPERTFIKTGKKSAAIGLKNNALEILQIQPVGKNAMDIASFINGAGRYLDGKKVD